MTCDRCGECCKKIPLLMPIDTTGKTPEEAAAIVASFVELLDSREGVKVLGVDDAGVVVEVTAKCKHLIPGGEYYLVGQSEPKRTPSMCKIYDKRPEFCRSFNCQKAGAP